MFPPNGSTDKAPPFPLWGPFGLVPPLLRSYCGATTAASASRRASFPSLGGTTFCSLYFALSMPENSHRKPGVGHPCSPPVYEDGRRSSPRFLVNLLCLCPALRPRSDESARSLQHLHAAPAFRRAEAPTSRTFRGSITRLLHSLSTLHAMHHFLACKTRFRLLTMLCRAGFFLPARFKLEVSVHHFPLYQALPGSVKKMPESV